MIDQILSNVLAWFAHVGGLLLENYELVNGIAMILFAVGLISQMVINAILEEDLIDLVERIEALESDASGCRVESGEAEWCDDEILDESEEG